MRAPVPYGYPPYDTWCRRPAAFPPPPRRVPGFVVLYVLCLAWALGVVVLAAQAPYRQTALRPRPLVLKCEVVQPESPPPRYGEAPKLEPVPDGAAPEGSRYGAWRPAPVNGR